MAEQPAKIERKIEDTQRRSLRSGRERPHTRRLLTKSKPPKGAAHSAIVETGPQSVVILKGANTRTQARALKTKLRRMHHFPYPMT